VFLLNNYLRSIGAEADENSRHFFRTEISSSAPSVPQQSACVVPRTSYGDRCVGHDNLDVTAHYAQVSTLMMMTTCNQAHPHARSVTRSLTHEEGR
jgi:hypothetical protein